jgi:hypothetical protein
MHDAQYEPATATVRTHLKDIDHRRVCGRPSLPDTSILRSGVALLFPRGSRLRDAGYRRGRGQFSTARTRRRPVKTADNGAERSLRTPRQHFGSMEHVENVQEKPVTVPKQTLAASWPA